MLPGVTYEPANDGAVVTVNVSAPVQTNRTPAAFFMDRPAPAAIGTMSTSRPRGSIAIGSYFLVRLVRFRPGRHCGGPSCGAVAPTPGRSWSNLGVTGRR